MHTTKILTRKLEDALADLAKDCLYPVEVAARLLAAGCTGQPNECSTCPVAVWLAKRLDLPSDFSVVVDESEATLIPDRDEFAPMPVAALPGVIGEFIRQFDRQPEDYPDLVAP
jgi:hypothetical protein